MPPKGRRGSDLTNEFTKQQPASNSVAAIRSPFAESPVKTAAPSPKMESLANYGIKEFCNIKTVYVK